MANSENKNETEEYEFKFKNYEIEGKKWCLPTTWEEQGEGFRNFMPKPDDVWIFTQPRSGTTLTQELVWLLANDLDFETAHKFHLLQRSPELPASLFPNLWEKCELLEPSSEDSSILKSIPVDTKKYSYEVYANARSPRILKLHLAPSVFRNLLSSGCKIVYTLRNPKDAIVSMARFACGPKPLFKGGYEKYIEKLISSEATPYGPYWEHVKEGWSLRNHPNVLFLHYEDMRRDMPATIRKVAKFLGKNYSDEDVSQLAAHLHIDNFRKNPMVNELPGFEEYVSAFVGKGRVAGWHEVITPELEKKVDRWIEDNVKGTDITFPVHK